MDGVWELVLIGGRRRAVAGGTADLGICHYLGPTSGSIDLRAPGGALLLRIRGGGMPVPDYHADIHSGERVRVFEGDAAITVESNRRAPAEVRVEEDRVGWRVFTLVESGPIGGVFRVRPHRGGEPWRLEVPTFGDPVRALAILHAAERLRDEADRRATRS